MLAGSICSDPCWCHIQWSTCGVYWRGAEHRVHRTCDSDGIWRRVARRAARGPHGRFGGTHLYCSCQSARATLGSDRWQRHLGYCRRWDSINGVIAWACEWPGSRRCNPGDVTAALSAPSWRGCCTDRGDGRSCGDHSRLDVPANASGDQRSNPDHCRGGLSSSVWHSYPHRPVSGLQMPAGPQVEGIPHPEDLDAALADLGETFDIGRDDLELLFDRVRAHGAMRRGSEKFAGRR